MSENHTRSALSVTVRPVDGTTVVTLRGELDLHTSTALTTRLDTLAAVRHPDLVLDLRAMSFVDCAGLGALCRTRNRVGARHGRLRLVTGSGRFLRILRATGLGSVFEVHPQLPCPVSAPGPNGPTPGRELVPSGPSTPPSRPM